MTAPSRPVAGVRSGLDRLAAGEGPALKGRPVSLLCHPASVDAHLRGARELLLAQGAKLRSLLGPEHGIDAAAQDMETVGEAAPKAAETPVYSLYGDTVESLWPQASMFHDADLLVIDLQDVGARYYTYVWTAVMASEVALRAGLEVLLLDRPNPIGANEASIEGGEVEPGMESFVGWHNVATRHAMTLAEVVTMALHERGKVDASARKRLQVLEMTGWERDMLASETGLPWVLPSPNMPTLETALVYPGQCLIEGTLLSEGRGSTRPFELFGAPWVRAEALLAALDPDDFPGLGLRVVGFKPTFQKLAGQSCQGLQLHVREPRAIRSLRSSIALLHALMAQRREAGLDFPWRTEIYEFVSDPIAIDLLAGGSWMREGLEQGQGVAELHARSQQGQAEFRQRRSRFLRYPAG